MSINKPKRIEDYILLHLREKPVLMLDLIHKIQQDRPKTTKQAVYAALRVLKQNEQIVTYKGMAALNLTWLNTMENYFNLAKHNYSEGNFDQGNFLDLNDKEKIKYYFQNSVKADIFWTHAIYLLMAKAKPNEPIFLYNPHEWFLLARNENELGFFQEATRASHQICLTSGHATFLDKYVRKYFNNDSSQYNVKTDPVFKKNNYYLNIIGKFLIEAWLDEKVANNLEQLYQNTLSWNDEVIKKIQLIVAAAGKMKIIISRNKQRAAKMSKIFKKDFFLKLVKRLK